MMASAPCSRELCSFDSRGSGSLNNEYLPRRLLPVSGSLNGNNSPRNLSSDSFVAYSAAPVHPCDDDGFSELDSTTTASSPTGSPLSPLFCCSQLSERHVFLCFKEPQSWPSVVEGADSDRLPRFLSNAIKLRRMEMMKKTRLIMCEGRDGTDSSNGDVMIFPDMVRYRGLTHFDVDAFVDEVLVRNRDWLPGRPEKLQGTHVFVCAHGGHEVKFGVLGPAIIEKFREQIALRGLGATLFVKPCSYIGGKKFARNLIVYNSMSMGEVSGHCYGSVTPDNVSSVLDDFCSKGYLAGVHDRLMDLGNDLAVPNSSQDRSVDLCPARKRNQHNHELNINGDINVSIDGPSRLHVQKALMKGEGNSQQKRRAYSSSTWWQASWWFSFWEKEDTMATLAVVGATASVCLAYHLYKSHSRH
eukprot:c23613_g2_i1 orf=662-1906(+)